jgi:hypothetical protein
VTRQLRDEQENIEEARKTMDQAERDLRNNSKLFVWVDWPNSRKIDWIVLTIFTLGFLSASAAQLIRKDRLMQLL